MIAIWPLLKEERREVLHMENEKRSKEGDNTNRFNPLAPLLAGGANNSDNSQSLRKNTL